MSTASAQSCQQTRGLFAFFWLLCPVFRGLFLGLLLSPCFGCLAGFRGLRFLGFGGLLTSLEPICHLDDIVQCLRWLITTADTCTAPERVFSHLHLFQFIDLCGLNRNLQDGLSPIF